MITATRAKRSSLQRRGKRAALRRVNPAYLFILPTFATLIALKYYPAASAVYHSFFQWDGFTTPRFVGLANYRSWCKTT